jgi:RNA recognition motif-containing protein
MNIYVGNLPYNITEDELRDAFSPFGRVTRASIVIDRETNRSKGFGFIEMSDNAEGEAAINALNETDLKGRNIKVNEARPRADRNDRGPRGGY